MTSDTKDPEGTSEIVIRASASVANTATPYERYIDSMPDEQARDLVMERHRLSARIVLIDVMHGPDFRKLCRECGREWPCKTYMIANGRDDA